jgi:two-component system, sensor histidine kinase
MSGADEPEPAAVPSVLVVDDYAPNRTALRALLAPVATVTEAESGERAIEEIARREYAVVVLDIQMPGMSGVEVARRIRAGGHNAHVPIIFVTAMDAEMAPFLEGYAVGAVDFLRRPIDSVILRAKVSVFAELYQRRDDASRAAAERARLEVERAATERTSRLKDRLLSILSHELRTPLTSILLWSDMLLHKPLSAEAVRQGIETIDLCARHEARLVDNVLEMSHLLAGTMILDAAAVDVGELVAEAVAEIAAFANDRGVHVVCPAEPGPWPAVADRARLRHVLFNILDNAVKFTPKGGCAQVSVENLGDLLHIRVSDTGIGFPVDSGPSLFERFEQAEQGSTRARGGLGMGLATAKALVELHGGALTAASDGPGLGATFTVTLPPAGPGPIAPGSSS